jgi:hypothetical protein
MFFSKQFQLRRRLLNMQHPRFLIAVIAKAVIILIIPDTQKVKVI